MIIVISLSNNISISFPVEIKGEDDKQTYTIQGQDKPLHMIKTGLKAKIVSLQNRNLEMVREDFIQAVQINDNTAIVTLGLVRATQPV